MMKLLKKSNSFQMNNILCNISKQTKKMEIPYPVVSMLWGEANRWESQLCDSDLETNAIYLEKIGNTIVLISDFLDRGLNL